MGEAAREEEGESYLLLIGGTNKEERRDAGGDVYKGNEPKSVTHITHEDTTNQYLPCSARKTVVGATNAKVQAHSPIGQ